MARSSRLLFVKLPQQSSGERVRQPAERWRDDDDVIRARLKAALLATCSGCGIVYVCVGLGHGDDVSHRNTVVLI